MKILNNVVEINEKMFKQFELYYEILLEESQKYNLTSITSKEDVIIKHFYDSILLLKYFNLSDKKVVDVGSGAGFPGIPLKIVCPEAKIVLVEPTTKRAKFLQLVIEKLELKDIEVINDRAENVINNYRECFDFATARAVAPLNILLELLVPFIKVNGKVLALKGSSLQEEIELSTKAFKELHVNVENIINDELPNNFGTRNLLVLNKQKQTSNKYPRVYAQIKKKPL